MSLLISIMNPLISLLPDLCLILILLQVILSYKSLFYLITHCWTSLCERVQVYHHFTIPKFDENSRENPMYRKSKLYLKSLPTSENSDYGELFSSPTRSNHFSFQPAPGQTVVDSFNGARIYWTIPSDSPDHLEIRVRQVDRIRVLRPYLMMVEADGDRIERQSCENPTRGVPIPVTLPTRCDFEGFRALAVYYLGVEGHDLFEDVKEMIEKGRRIRVAEVADILMANRSSAPRAIRRVIEMLRKDGREGEGSRRFRKVRRIWGDIKRRTRTCF